MSRILLIALSILLPALSFSQSDKKKENTHIIPEEYSSIHHDGEQAMLMNKFGEALRQFKRVLKKFPDFPPALRSAGACYELMGDFEKAAQYYEASIESSPNFSRAMYYEIGNIHYKCGRYDLALQCFETFDSLLQQDAQLFTYNGFEEKKIEQSYLEKLDGSYRACQIAMDSIQFWNIKNIKNLGGNVNTKADEYFPFLTNDGQTIFYTSRKDKFADENLFVAGYGARGWSGGGHVAGFNSNQNEGMTTLVRDGRNVFFTACERESVLGTCDIWQATVNGKELKDVKPTTGQLNSEEWESQASINCDGSVLFFASNREGGQGGTDIWKCHRLPNGDWDEPINLGSEVNSNGDEEAPFITNDGRTLYFSSTGHMGLGEQDIFMSRMDGENQWSTPVNLGVPVNSSYRELGFFLSANGKQGYFASDRVGGKGGMDIYHFELPDALVSESITYVEGMVQDSITRMPVANAKVAFKNRRSITTDEEGRFFLCIKAGEEFDMKILHKEYHPYSSVMAIPEWENTDFYTLDLLLDPLFKLPSYTDLMAAAPSNVSFTSKSPFGKEIKQSVLFDFNKAELKIESLEELDQFLGDNFNPEKVKYVEVIGFADQIGDDAYNYLLSEKRAKEVGLYLKGKGIEVNKVHIEGKGETINDEPDWKNRKVEVVLHLSQ